MKYVDMSPYQLYCCMEDMNKQYYRGTRETISQWYKSVFDADFKVMNPLLILPYHYFA